MANAFARNEKLVAHKGEVSCWNDLSSFYLRQRSLSYILWSLPIVIAIIPKNHVVFLFMDLNTGSLVRVGCHWRNAWSFNFKLFFQFQIQWILRIHLLFGSWLVRNLFWRIVIWLIVIVSIFTSVNVVSRWLRVMGRVNFLFRSDVLWLVDGSVI